MEIGIYKEVGQMGEERKSGGGLIIPTRFNSQIPLTF